MKIKTSYISTVFLLASMVSTNAMKPLPTKLHELKTGLELLQEKLLDLKDSLEDLKEQLQPTTSSFYSSSPETSESEEEQSLTEKSWTGVIRDTLSGYAQTIGSSLFQVSQQSVDDPNWREYELLPGSDNPYNYMIVIELYALPEDDLLDEPLLTIPNSENPKSYNFSDLPPPLPNSGRGKFGIRRGRIRNLPIGPPKSRYDYETRKCLAAMSVSGYQKMFQNTFPSGDRVKNEWSFLSNDELYKFENFLTYARSLASYDNYILNLKERIDSSKKFRATLKQVPGFQYSFDAKRQKSEFLDLIKAESDAIIDKRCAQEGCLDLSNKSALSTLARNYKQKNRSIPRKEPGKERLRQRLATLNQVIKHGGRKINYAKVAEKYPEFTDPYAGVFEHCYGTALDRQLHEDLCDTRVMMMELEGKHTDNPYVHGYSPMIYRITALAKKEQDVEKAFNYADFSYDLVSIISSAVFEGVKTTLDPRTYVNTTIGILKLGILLAQSGEPMDEFDIATHVAIFPDDKDTLFKISEQYQLRCQEQAQVAQESYEQLKEKLNAMTWQEKTSLGVQVTTELLLAWGIPRMAKFAGTLAGCELVSNLAKVMKSPFSKEAMLDIAVVETIAAEEGSAFAASAIESIKKNPKLLTAHGGAGAKATMGAEVRLSEKVITESKDVIKRYEGHIFSPEHRSDGIMALGESKEAIMGSLHDVIKSVNEQGLLKEGQNQIKTIINGINNIEIRCFIKNGEILSIDAFKSKFGRIFNALITWP